MKRFLYFLFMGVLVGGGLALSIYYGQQPQPKPLIKMNPYQDVEAYAKAVAAELQLPLRKHPILFLGVMPELPEQFDVAERFLASLNEDGLRYDVVVVEPGLGPEGFFPDAVTLSLNKEQLRLAEGVRNALSKGLRMVVIAPSLFTGAFDDMSPAAEFQRETGQNVMTVSFSGFPFDRNAEKRFPLNCRTESQGSVTSLGSLSCVALTTARGQYGRHWDPAKFVGSLDQVGERDYLGLLHAPTMEGDELMKPVEEVEP